MVFWCSSCPLPLLQHCTVRSMTQRGGLQRQVEDKQSCCDLAECFPGCKFRPRHPEGWSWTGTRARCLPESKRQKLQTSAILPKAETVITGHHTQDWDLERGSGKAQYLVRAELSGGEADITQEGRSEHGWETRAPCKDRDQKNPPNPGI